MQNPVAKRLLIVAMKHNYDDPNAGFSYEWNHFYLGLKDSFTEVSFFDFLSSYHASGKLAMQDALLSKVQEFSPDIILFVPHLDQFDTSFFASLKKYAKTLCFFHDDTWRVDFVKKWATHFDAFTTSDFSSVKRYQDLGLSNAVYFPFGVNEKLFWRDNEKLRDIDVSFVGSWHPYREWLINGLKKSGIKVSTFGYNWPSGAVSTEDMIDIFQRSKITLTLSNSIHFNLSYLLSSPRAFINSFRSKKRGEQIKGRHFEVAACGAMQLSFYANGLEKLFLPRKEIVIYRSEKELKHQVRFYLRHAEERAAIAEAAYRRTLKEHTYSKRFTAVFQKLGWI